MEKFGVIDLGSNSARLGIYSDEGGFCEHYRKRINCRLSEGLSSDNLLKDVPMERTIASLEDFKNILEQNNIKTLFAVATESLRRAENAAMFLKNVKSRTGIDISVIDGNKEAELGVYACSSVVNMKDYYILDTGGGSFELSLVEDNSLKDFVCLPYGAVVLKEDFQPDKNGTEEILCFLEQRLKEVSFVKKNSFPVVALGGSVKALSQANGISGDIDGKKISADLTFKLFNEIFTTPVNLRPEKFNMEDARKDIIVSGLSPLVSLLSLTDSKDIYFCTKSIRDGVAKEYIDSKRKGYEYSI